MHLPTAGYLRLGCSGKSPFSGETFMSESSQVERDVRSLGLFPVGLETTSEGITISIVFQLSTIGSRTGERADDLSAAQ